MMQFNQLIKSIPQLQYAIVGLEDAIFVKQYMIQLPSEDEIREALERYLKNC